MNKLLLSVAVFSLISGCASKKEVITREVLMPCVASQSIPDKPDYRFGTLDKATTPEAKADAVYALYSDWVLADAYANQLRLLITPCIRKP